MSENRNSLQNSPAPPEEDGLSKALGAVGQFLKGGAKDTVEIPEGTTEYFNLSYNFAAALCYFPVFIAPFLWLKTESPDNKYLRFHCMQGLCLAGIMVGLQVILGTLGKIFGFIPGLNLLLPLIFALIRGVIGLLWGVICLKQMLRVYKKQSGRLPLLAKFADRWV